MANLRQNATTVMGDMDVARRLPVWCALSELFLDTELQPEDYRWIAGVLRASAYSRDELRAIYEDEVSPIFIFNLLSVAGVWAGWREEDVREIMLRSFNLGIIDKSLSWIVKRILRRELDDMWKIIENNLETTDATHLEASS